MFTELSSVQPGERAHKKCNKDAFELGVVAQACGPSTWEAEEGGLRNSRLVLATKEVGGQTGRPEGLSSNPKPKPNPNQKIFCSQLEQNKARYIVSAFLASSFSEHTVGHASCRELC